MQQGHCNQGRAIAAWSRDLSQGVPNYVISFDRRYAPATTAAAPIARARFLSPTHCSQDSNPARLREGIPARVVFNGHSRHRSGEESGLAATQRSLTGCGGKPWSKPW